MNLQKKKKKQMNLQNRDSETYKMNLGLCGERCREGQLGSLGWTFTLCCVLFKMDNQQDLLYSAWNSVECYVAAWMGGDLTGRGGERIHVYAWLNPSAVHLKLSPHCSSASPQHKIIS